MRQLASLELLTISGASQGTYYYEGVGYEFTCPDVSQECLNTYLSFLEKLPPGSNIPPASLGDVLNICGGPEAIATMSPCFDPVIKEIRKRYGLS